MRRLYFVGHLCRLSYRVLASSLLGACCGASSYQGDGTLVDHGGHLLIRRYEVNFGNVDLTRNEVRHFRASGLPEREFVLGLRLESEDCSPMKGLGSITFSIIDEHGATVVHEERLLRDLTWTTAFAKPCHAPFGYVRGTAKEISRGNRDVCMQPVITGSDHGRGTYFSSRTSGTYDVAVAVKAEPLGNQESQLAALILQDNGATGSVSNSCP